MSLRLRLVASLGAVITIALVVAGVLLVALLRVGLVDRIDRELVSIANSPAPMQRLLTVDSTDSPGGRSLAVIRYNRNGAITLSLPSGFTDSPDPLPAMPNYTAGVPATAVGRVMQVAAVDGSMDYRVLLANGRLGAVIALAAPLSSVDATVATLVRILLLVGVVAIATVLAVSWLIVRRGLLPLERVADAAGRIAGGDLAHRTGVPHDGSEVGRLGAAFDGMVDQVQSAFVQQHEALAAKHESESRLRRFVADASHELRTPVTAIRGYAELYRAGGLAEADALAAAMARIEGESRRMGSLVDDLLLLARLDQGRPLRRDVVDLSGVCADGVADLRATASTRPVVAALDAGVLVTGDEDRLRQMVANLLANVRLHTPADTRVEVVLRSSRISEGVSLDERKGAFMADTAAGGWAELRVVDHGPGVAPEHAAHVFDRFYRADAGRSRDTGGSGLGLSIVASIVAAHGGQLWHEATPGGGATFGALLPLAQTASQQPSLTATSQPSPGQS